MVEKGPGTFGLTPSPGGRTSGTDGFHGRRSVSQSDNTGTLDRYTDPFGTVETPSQRGRHVTSPRPDPVKGPGWSRFPRSGVPTDSYGHRPISSTVRRDPVHRPSWVQTSGEGNGSVP